MSMSAAQAQAPPRFQRRTTERAVLEDAFKPRNMDYSNVPSDADHPEETSPWATSPKQTREYMSRSADSAQGLPNPQSPFGPSGSEAANYTEESSGPALPGPERHAQPQSPYHDGRHEDLSEQLPPAAMNSQGDFEAQRASQQQARQQQAARYHNRQAPKPQPQYRLQCKITQLERNGKKDPILRFDAYVRNDHVRIRLLS